MLRRLEELFAAYQTDDVVWAEVPDYTDSTLTIVKGTGHDATLIIVQVKQSGAGAIDGAFTTTDGMLIRLGPGQGEALWDVAQTALKEA